MRAVRTWALRLTSFFRRARQERELDAELTSHLGMHIDENVRAGMSSEEARRQALLALGGVEQTKERHRERRGFQWIDELGQHLRYASRTLVRNPGFTATAIVTLALGIGANAAVFAVTYGILLRPLPYPESSRLLVFNLLFRDGGDLGFSPAQAGQLIERLDGLGEGAAYNVRDLTVRTGSESELVSTGHVSREFFRVLRVPARYGRTEDFANEGGLVITTRLAERLLHVPPLAAIGQTVTVGANEYQIAAVILPAYGFPEEATDAWIPAPALSAASKQVDTGNFRIVLRLRHAMTVDQVRQEVRQMRGISSGGRDDFSVSAVGETAAVEMAPVLRVSLAAALLVLLVACANVATLFIGRNIIRRREVAARLALGASPIQLARGFFVESMLLAAVAAVVGAALAAGLIQLFVKQAAGVVPRVLAVSLDWPVLVSTVVLTGFVAILCGALPAWQATKADFRPFLRTTVVSTPAAWKLRSALVVLQMAASMVLLIGAGLLTRSVMQLLNQDDGFTTSGVIEAKIVLSDRPLGGERSSASVRELLARVRALPGVDFAGLGNALPPSPRLITVATQFVDKDEGINESRFIKIGSATPGFLRALGARFLSGRDFSDTDAGDVVVLSESAARFLFRGRDPIGGHVTSLPRLIQFAGKPVVIGVVRDIKYEGLDTPPGSTVYVPWDRRPMGTTHLVVRARGDQKQLSDAIRRITRELDAGIPVPEIQPLANVLSASIASRRLRMFPAVGFGLLALAVALLGLLATLSRAVAERRQELAIRAAIGASATQLVRMVLAKGLVLTGVGVVTGLAASWAVSRNLSHLLFRVSASDPVTFGIVTLLVTLGSVLAVYIAARRAAAVDPLTVLRYE